MTSASPILTTDHIDTRRTQQLQRTLPTRVGSHAIDLEVAGLGQTLPPGHHLVLCQPETPLDQLGADGSSTEYNAPAPYTRRMWAGGSFTWNDDPNKRLIIGQDVTETTRVAQVEYKKDMLFVYQEKKFYPGSKTAESEGEDQNWAVKEVRTHVFRKPIEQAVSDAVPELTLPDTFAHSHIPLFTYKPTSPLLFRYSALTYNGHKIHYDRDWVRNIEGRRDLVVHGPLTATILIEIASKLARDKGKTLRHFEYRATSPMYVDEQIDVHRRKREESPGSEEIVDLFAAQERRIGMKALATIR